MKNNYKSIFLLILLVLSANIYALRSTKTIFINNNINNFTIRLKSNPTTGYTWILKSYDQKLLKLTNVHYNRPISTLVGAPGSQQWTFHVLTNDRKQLNNESIIFEYVRPWNKNEVGTTTTYKIKLSQFSKPYARGMTTQNNI